MNEHERKLLAEYPQFAIIFDALRLHSTKLEMETLMVMINNYAMDIQIKQNKRFIETMSKLE